MNTTDNTELGQTIKNVLPSCLDNIVREHRDELSVRLSTTEDFAELHPMVATLGEPKQIRTTINEWRIVCVDINMGDKSGKRFILTGINETTDSVWATSFLKSVDFENNLVLTENSIYRLGTKGEGEPTFHVLLHICYLFHQWGFGARYGVPEIFY
jgi:hypothetical protein